MKVAIIGCSVAGLGTALELLKLDKSADVTIFDKKPYVGAHTICGGAISSFMLKELNMKLPNHVIGAEITAVRIYAPCGEFWELQSERRQPYGYILWREAFEKYLAQQVAELGGKIRMNYEIKDLNELSDYDYIVGADGLTGVSSKLLGFPPKEDVHIAVQRIAYMRNHPKNRIDLYFGNEVAPKGYAWVFPEGYDRRARVGLGVPLSERVNPKKLLDRFMESIEAEPVLKLKAKLIPTAGSPKKLVFGRTLLVGDAAHLCDPSTGGGIANALLSGKYAAKAIVEGNPEKYDRYVRGLKRRNLYRYRLKQVLYELTDEEFNEMIYVMKRFKPNLVRISWAILHAILTLALKKPKLFTKHKVLRRLVGLR